MSKIRLLDDHTANQIAAGEVVERPVSIVKELVENSIDAQSRNIEVEITDGGIRYIRVTDDGSGMDRADAENCLLRHATSKISSADDLHSLGSLGFRGEALPSIAAVSRFAVTTRTALQDIGTYVRVEGGQLLDLREAGCGVGTTVTVEELFYNVPARLKFLKTPSSEGGHINDALCKLALAYPEISFRLIHNGRLVLSTPGNEDLKETINHIYGHKVLPELLPVDYRDEERGIAIEGYLSKPTLLKGSRHWQSYIINRRVISNRSIAKALDNAYHSLLPKSGYPLAVLQLTVPCETLDVNVHPQKSEVKFSDEQIIFRAVYKAVSQALTLKQSGGAEQLATSLDSVLPGRMKFEALESKAGANDSEMLFKKSEYATPREARYETPQLRETAADFNVSELRAAIEVQDGVRDEFIAAPKVSGEKPPEEMFVADGAALSLYPLGQIDDCFIIATDTKSLYLVDQHAAHERILYEKLCSHSERIPAQQLLIPVYLDLSERELEIIRRESVLFAELGFTIEPMGPNVVRVCEVPCDLGVEEIETMLREMIGAFLHYHQPTAAELRHHALQIASCRGAIKAGLRLNMRQMQALLDELCLTSRPYACPHGRPCMLQFTPQQIDKLFKRT